MMSTAAQFHSTNYVENQPHSRKRAVYQPQDWLTQPTLKKGPHSVAEMDWIVWEEQQTRALPETRNFVGLDDAYVFDSRTAVIRFINENRLYGLLLEAKQPLKERFGEASIKTLSITNDDEGFETLYCIVVLSCDLRQARQALRTFDREWWLSRAGRAAGRLNFDFRFM